MQKKNKTYQIWNGKTAPNILGSRIWNRMVY